jgi:AraC-like DNA-binding protein
MAGHALNPKRVTLAYPAPKSSFYLEQFLQCEVEYNAPNNTLIFNLDDVKQRSLGCNPQINQAHIQMLDQFLSRVDKKNLSYIIVDKICEKLPLGAPSQQEIANELGMSLRNLQRKLNEQGTSYKEILENTRKRLTLEYIKQPHLSLSEIGYLVGFSSVANFNRAFRRWVDSTPGEYRSRYLENIVLPSANIHLSPIGV